MDILHIGTIINFPNVSTIIYNIDSHDIMSKLIFGSIVETIITNFDILYKDQILGNDILLRNIKRKK